MSYIDKIHPTGAPSPLGDKKGKNNQNNDSSNETTSGGKSFDEYLKEAREGGKDSSKQQFFNNVLRKPIINFDSSSDNNLNNIQKKIAEDKSKKVEVKSAKTENKIDTSASDENASKFKQFINNRNSTTNNTNGTLSGSSTSNGASSTNGTTVEKVSGSGEVATVKRRGRPRKQATISSSSGGSTSGDNGVLKKPEDGSFNKTNAEATQQETLPQNEEQSRDNNKNWKDNKIVQQGKEILTGQVQNKQQLVKDETKKSVEKINAKAEKGPKEEVLDSRYYGDKDGSALTKENAKIKNLEKEIDKSVKNGWGIQKWATTGGAIFGAISNYKKQLEKWEYECQRAAAEGRPIPKKPSLVGSMAMGAAGGAVTGFMVGGVAKHVGPMSRIDKNLKVAGRNRSMNKLNEKYGFDVQKKVDTWKGMTRQAKLQQVNKGLRKDINNAGSALQKYKGILDKGGNLNEEQWNYIAKLRNTQAGQDIITKMMPGVNLDDVRYKALYGFFSNVAYVSKCFSIMEVYKNSAIGDVERFKELYNFYTLHMNEEPMDVYTFLRECFDYPSFVRYIEQAMQRFIQEELITFSDLIDGYASDTLSNYKVLYKNYQTVCGTTLDPQEFLERCVIYPSYVEYITKKVKRTELLKMGLQSFAEVSSTSLPQNVQVNGENIDTTEEGLPDAKNYESMKNQNSLQTKEQQAKARQAQLQKQREEQQKQQQIEANKANYAKAQQAKMQDKITKLSQQKASISKDLGRNASDMQVGQLAQEKQKVTNLNLKIQAVKTDTKNKIANYKGTGGKNFSLKKPCII